METPPTHTTRRTAFALARALPLLAALLVGCSDRGATPPDPGIPPEVLAHADDWPLPGRDYSNSRATSHSTISSANVARLGVAWEANLPARGVAYGSAATTPLILGDTVYVQDLSSNVMAVDRETGATRWVKRYGRFIIGPNGVAVGWGKLFAAKSPEEIAALDLATGEELWATSIVRTKTEGVDIQPTVYGGMVFASSVPVSLEGIYTGGDRGVLHALDAESGTVVWRFDTVDSADVWGNPEVNSGGGSWYPPAIDPGRGLIYWGIANPAPFPGTPEFPNGSSRPGPNLYTDSVVALDVRSGELAWYHQAIAHDIFDRDLIHTLLVDVGTATDSRRIAVGTGKLGRVLGHDPDTGALLWDTPVGRHENDDLDPLPTGETDVYPGSYGGVLTPPAAADGKVYVAVINAPSTYVPDQPAYFGSRLGSGPGEVVAIDAATGTIVWDAEIDGDPLGAATVVNDLVLTATFQGRVFALDRATGGTLWTWEAPGGINAWPAVAGDTIVWPIGMADPPRLVALRPQAGGDAAH